jgi:hypothetical protein
VGILRNFEHEQPERPQATESFIPRKRSDRSAHALARGTLACPTCDLPVVAGGPIPIAARVRCPFCRTIHTARAFVRIDTPDTSLNEVLVTARMKD